MNKCIYCFTEDSDLFSGREHIVPNAFVRSKAKAHTIDCVCIECNKYFNGELDLYLTRHSPEGIARYSQGIQSRETRYQDFVEISVLDSGEMHSFNGALVWVDGKTNQLDIFSQAHFKKLGSDGIEKILKEDLIELDWRSEGLSDQIHRVFAPTKEDFDDIVGILKNIGINTHSIKSEFQKPPSCYGQPIGVEVSFSSDPKHMRALLKILVNFCAKYFGAEEILKPQWNQVRNYVRFNTEPKIGREMFMSDYWGTEFQASGVFDSSVKIRVENSGSHLLGVIQFYNLESNEFRLANNYKLQMDKIVGGIFYKGASPKVFEYKPSPIKTLKRRVKTNTLV